MKKILSVLKSPKTLVLACLAFTMPVFAADVSSPVQNKVCHDNQVLSAKLITDVCWNCIFPIKLAGINLSMTGTAPDNAASGTVCACKDGLNVYHPGVLTAMWEPRKLIELTRTPGCMSSLGGVTLDLGNDLQFGPQTDGAAEEQRERFSISFYNAHMYAMPLLRMLDMYLPGQCNADPYSDFDIINFTEIDPTWNNTMLAFFQNPESAAVANVIAMQACAGEAAAQFAGKQPIDSLWWCAGSWGAVSFNWIGTEYGCPQNNQPGRDPYAGRRTSSWTGLPFNGKRYCLSLQDLPNVAKATVQIEYVLPYPGDKK